MFSVYALGRNVFVYAPGSARKLVRTIHTMGITQISASTAKRTCTRKFTILLRGLRLFSFNCFSIT